MAITVESASVFKDKPTDRSNTVRRRRRRPFVLLLSDFDLVLSVGHLSFGTCHWQLRWTIHFAELQITVLRTDKGRNVRVDCRSILTVP